MAQLGMRSSTYSRFYTFRNMDHIEDVINFSNYTKKKNDSPIICKPKTCLFPHATHGVCLERKWAYPDGKVCYPYKQKEEKMVMGFFFVNIKTCLSPCCLWCICRADVAGVLGNGGPFYRARRATIDKYLSLFSHSI